MAKNNFPYAGVDQIDSLLSVNDPVPCLKPIPAEELFSDLVELLKRYIIMSDHDAIAMALWIIHTYCYRQFSHSPLLLINAPERACGKSVALGVVAKLVPRPLECANITVAALFRVVQNRNPTVLIDEADTFLDGKPDLAGILNKGYEQGGMVLRVETVGDRLVEVGYRVFGPKALAGITLERCLPDATLSRGIQISMRRKVKGEEVERLRNINLAELSRLRSQIHRFVSDSEAQIQEGTSDLPEELSDREQDNWEPLFTIASCIGSQCLELAREAALSVKAATLEPQSASNNLLSDIYELLSGYQERYIPTSTLVEMLTKDPDMGWGTYNKGFPLTPRQLARNLQPYRIRPKTVRMSTAQTPKGYEVYEFQDAFVRYLNPARSEGALSSPGDAPAEVSKIEEQPLYAVANHEMVKLLQGVSAVNSEASIPKPHTSVPMLVQGPAVADF